MAHGRKSNPFRSRTHPTQSLGVMSEINTVHAFGNQGRETSGWPYQGHAYPGTLIGNRIYRPARLNSSEDLKGSRRRRKRRKK
jgi:hypothetical protein